MAFPPTSAPLCSTPQRSAPARQGALVPGQIDPAVAELRRANPTRFHDVRTGHLAVVAMVGRPWFIGRVCDVSCARGSRTSGFVQVINVDDGEPERIPAPWIVELFSDAGLG